MAVPTKSKERIIIPHSVRVGIPTEGCSVKLKDATWLLSRKDVKSKLAVVLVLILVGAVPPEAKGEPLTAPMLPSTLMLYMLILLALKFETNKKLPDLLTATPLGPSSHEKEETIGSHLKY